MITRILYFEEKAKYNSLVKHPVQTWEWGDFQTSQGHKVYRLGVFKDKEMVGAYMISFHRLPKVNYQVGTLWRGPTVDDEMIKNVKKIAADEKAIFVKFEPESIQKIYHPDGTGDNFSINTQFDHYILAPKVNFYPYTYLVDLTKTEDQLLEQMHPKTRYNIKLANRHGVQIADATSDAGFEVYLKLIFDTTHRQGFYLHDEDYHRALWQTLKKTGMVKIIMATYEKRVLSAFMLFVLKDRLFYPYGASLDLNREVMAPNLLMWEAIKWGKEKGCKTFDMWGCLGPDAKESDRGYGFTRFKQGYGGDLIQYVGSYDLIINHQLYQLYNLVDKYRWHFLRLKAKVLK